MRYFYFIFLLILSATPWHMAQSAMDTPQDQVRITTDPEHGTITFYIDDEPAVQINRDGLHVVNSIVYGTTITDTGPAHVKKLISSQNQEEERHDKQ